MIPVSMTTGFDLKILLQLRIDDVETSIFLNGCLVLETWIVAKLNAICRSASPLYVLRSILPKKHMVPVATKDCRLQLLGEEPVH